MHTITTTQPTARVPWHVRLFSPVLGAMLRAGVPLGPNGLLTVTGRTSGLPRTAPVAIIELDGRRWIWAPWGEVHWVRNLRAAGTATLHVRGRTEAVSAAELDAAERVVFFRDVLGRKARAVPGGVAFIRLVDQTDLRHPETVAVDRRVFELRPAA